MQLHLVFGRQMLGDFRQVHQHAGRIIGFVVNQRHRHAHPDHFAALLAAPYFHQAFFEKQFGDIAVFVVFRVQEKHVLANSFSRTVAEQGFSALVPAGQVAGQVEHDDRFERLFKRVGVLLAQLVGQRHVVRRLGINQRLLE